MEAGMLEAVAESNLTMQGVGAGKVDVMDAHMLPPSQSVRPFRDLQGAANVDCNAFLYRTFSTRCGTNEIYVFC